jgi:hypothetical protein
MAAKRAREQAAFERQRAAQEAADDAKCQGYGTQKGSQAYIACRMQLTELHSNEAATAAVVNAQNAATQQRQSQFMMGCGFRMMQGYSC